MATGNITMTVTNSVTGVTTNVGTGTTTFTPNLSVGYVAFEAMANKLLSSVTTIPTFTPVKVPQKTVRECLDHAARIIEEYGWTRGAFERRGRVCMLQAIIMAAKGDYVLAQAAERRMLKHLPGRYIPAWNDAPERKKSEVLAALRWAAKPTIKEL